MWCVLRALNPSNNNPQRLDGELMGEENTLKMEGIEYPVSLKDINKFENQNPTISSTVLGYEGKSVYPLRNSDCKTLLFGKKYKSSAILSGVKWQKKRTFLLKMFEPF